MTGSSFVPRNLFQGLVRQRFRVRHAAVDMALARFSPAPDCEDFTASRAPAEDDALYGGVERRCRHSACNASSRMPHSRSLGVHRWPPDRGVLLTEERKPLDVLALVATDGENGTREKTHV